MSKKHISTHQSSSGEEIPFIDEHKHISDLNCAINLFKENVRVDKIKLAKIDASLSFMRNRAETAEAALKASDIALEALKILQANSLEVIRSGDVVIASLRATIRENDSDSDIKESALNELVKIIEKNKISLKASALALDAVNELAFNDALTGLPNRRLLSDRLKQAILSNNRLDSYSAAIFMDLDKFKLLNDEFGHETGDRLLTAVGQRLLDSVRESDTVARYGGDEFVILLNQLNGNLIDAKQEAVIVVSKILKSLLAPYTLTIRSDQGLIKTIKYQCFASLGVVMFNGDILEESKILDWADEAMYWAKSEGGQTVRFYDAKDSTEQALLKLYELATENDIETANHGIRTRQYVKALAYRAQQMNLYPHQLSRQSIERLFKTTQLHDIGKTKLPYAILHKKEKLSVNEWDLMKTHPTEGRNILERAKRQNQSLNEFLNTAIDIAESHHERWDGTGYPNGLVGDAIPIAGQIMSIADVYDALICCRSYKKAWTHSDACAEIISKGGTQFNPILIEAFKREADNFALIAEKHKD